MCLLRSLCVCQETSVRMGHWTTDWFRIGKGIQQGCILSSCLFNLYAEYIMWNAGLDESQTGIRIAGRNINNLRYTDDTLMSESEEELKRLMMKVKEESEKSGLKLSNKKKKLRSQHLIWSSGGQRSLACYSSCGCRVGHALATEKQWQQIIDKKLNSAFIINPKKEARRTSDIILNAEIFIWVLLAHIKNRLEYINSIVVSLLSCVWLFCSPMDCNPSGSSVHGMSQARIPEWLAISSSRVSSQPRDRTCICCIGRQILYHCLRVC